MNAAKLVEAAIYKSTNFKEIGAKLDNMRPSEQASVNVIQACRESQCEPWLAAYLLGCIGHIAGYKTAMEILVSGASSTAGYAGAAMTKIRGPAAYEDLRKILFSDLPLKVRQGAIYGLERTGSPRLLDDLLSAFNQKLLTRNKVALSIAQCEPSDDWLLTLIRSDAVTNQQLACAVFEKMSSPNSRQKMPGLAVVRHIREFAADENFGMMPLRRKNLRKWTA